MPKSRLSSLILDPRSLKQFADGHEETTAIGLNAVTGILLVMAAALALSEFFSPALIALSSLLFGPLVGFIVSSAYPRIELVGRVERSLRNPTQ